MGLWLEGLVLNQNKDIINFDLYWGLKYPHSTYYSSADAIKLQLSLNDIGLNGLLDLCDTVLQLRTWFWGLGLHALELRVQTCGFF